MSSSRVARFHPPRVNLDSSLETAQLQLRWPWWLHPIWAILLLTGSMAVISTVLPPAIFAEWGVPKYLDADRSLLLLLGCSALIVGCTISSARVADTSPSFITFTPTQLRFLHLAYRVLFVLAVLGYLFWSMSAVAQGVGLTDLADVVGREPSAIGRLKANSRPIAGLTTLTQFAPVAVAIAAVLRRVNIVGRSYWVLIAAAAFRTLFYAERLALIEVAVPLLLVASVTVSSRYRMLVKLGPLVAAPLIWVLFAASEYTRSWVVYQTTTSVPFSEWVTTRLIGYYVTAYNNSGLFSQALDGWSTTPYNSFKAMWNAPVLENILTRPDIQGMPAEAWWSSTLERYANLEFTNAGSFLVVQGELGTVGMLLFWCTAGVLLGMIYSRARKGNLPSLLAYLCLFIGVLELPRFIYWTEGRCVPILIALAVIAVRFPRERDDGIQLGGGHLARFSRDSHQRAAE